MRKATEYFEDFSWRIDDALVERSDAALSDLMHELTLEFAEISRIRNASSDSAAFAIMRELNEKYNSFVAKHNAVAKHVHLERNGYMTIMMSRLPETVTRNHLFDPWRRKNEEKV